VDEDDFDMVNYKSMRNIFVAYGGSREKRKNIENNIDRIADNSFTCIDKFHAGIITKNIWYESVGRAMGQCIL
jgi:hypothetical protein